jgi:hypothetical protein
MEAHTRTHLGDDAGLFKQIVAHESAADSTAWGDDNLGELAEAGAVVVHACLCVAKGLQQRVDLRREVH